MEQCWQSVWTREWDGAKEEQKRARKRGGAGPWGYKRRYWTSRTIHGGANSSARPGSGTSVGAKPDSLIHT